MECAVLRRPSQSYTGSLPTKDWVFNRGVDARWRNMSLACMTILSDSKCPTGCGKLSEPL
jgi:hypothetical protein